MKKILTLVFVLSIGFANAQTSTLKEYSASNGKIYKPGDSIKLGRGSDPQGNFRFLEMGGWGAVMTYNSHKDASQFNIGRAYSGTNVVIKKIKQTKIRGSLKTFFVVAGGNITNYNLSIEDAIATCEIADCNEAKNTSGNNTGESNLDKLKKLKDLYDSGVLSKEEYEEKKKKIIDSI